MQTEDDFRADEPTTASTPKNDEKRPVEGPWGQRPDGVRPDDGARKGGEHSDGKGRDVAGAEEAFQGSASPGQSGARRGSDRSGGSSQSDPSRPADASPFGGSSSFGSSGGRGDGGDRGDPPKNPWELPPPPRRKSPTSSNTSSLGAMMASFQRFGGGPRGNRSGGRIALMAGGALVFAWLSLTCFHRIDAQENGIVMRMGRYSHTLQPGVSLTFPSPIDRVHVLDVRNIRTIRIPTGDGQRLVLTGDQNIIDLDYSVRWDIKNPVQFLFQMSDPVGTVTAVAESAMREAMANASLNDAIGSGRGAIENEVANRTQAVLDAYGAGIRIQGVAIQRADPPDAVNDAFKQVTAAQQEAQTAVNRANAHAQQVVAGAEGAAGEFDRVYAQYRLAPEVTRRRLYYETMEEILSRVDKTVVEAPGVMPYLSLRDRPPPPEPASQTVVQARTQPAQGQNPQGGQ